MENLFETNVDFSADERFWASCCHLSAFAFFFLPFIGHILAPVVIWMLKRRESSFIDRQGKEALSFQMSVTIYAIPCLFLVIFVVGYVLLLMLFVFWVISMIVAAIKANDGIHYHYPLTIHFF
ncbi:MAG: DUF4870 domain-containing protein [Candidatus Omnitrophota bacterium]|jgi:uncharacterized Tic20 family protein|nr:MAG: DUF4870 domain-containing protein [Candidatus Omnitrophota bacterium]